MSCEGQDSWNGWEFSASSGFCDKFKKRHQLSLRTKARVGKLAAHSDGMHDWQEEVLPGLLQGYAPRNIYNAGEFALFYRLLQHKTLAFRREKCRGGKKNEWVSLLFACSLNGSNKLTSVMIGH